MAKKVWQLSDLFRCAGVLPLNSTPVPPVPFTSLTDDSRNVPTGSCFVAVPGTQCDGTRYIGAAVAAGAVAVVCGRDEPSGATPPAIPTIRVADPREALAKLAAAYFGLRGTGARLPKLIGVTGTNGKTTVTWLIRAILRTAGHKTALIGTIEYDLGGERLAAPLTTPGALTLCRHLAAARDAGATHGVFEVSSHALDQRRCDGLAFAAAVFTNLTGDHLDYHKSMDAYAAAKRRLFEGLSADTVAVINADDPRAGYFAAASAAPVTTFGVECRSADVRAEAVRMDRSGTSMSFRGRRHRIDLRASLVGGHNVSNLLAAAATAEALGVAPDAIRAGLEQIRGVPGRLQRVEPDGWPFSVLVDYAHTDDALRNVLGTLQPITTGRLICVFGCGGDRDRTKRPRMAAAVGELADAAFVTSDNPRTEDPDDIIRQILPGFAGNGRCRVTVDADRRAAIHAAVADARPGDTVLVAGKGHENYQLIGGQVLPFDDVEVAREALALRGATIVGSDFYPGPVTERERGVLKEERVA